MSAPAGSLVWLAIVSVAFGTWGFRVSFVALFGYLEGVPPRLDRTLRFIPPAVIAAIIGPDLLLVDGSLAASPSNERLLAGLFALAIAWYTENVFVTIAAGMVALWALLLLA